MPAVFPDPPGRGLACRDLAGDFLGDHFPTIERGCASFPKKEGSSNNWEPTALGQRFREEVADERKSSLAKGRFTQS